MTHRASTADQEFRCAFEAFEIAPGDFGHRGHVRLAYVYLCDSTVEEAHSRMKQALLAFLAHLGVGDSKYHETITRAWILAVRHFMARTPVSASADDFIDQNPILLDSKIMLSHYSAELLFSTDARGRFVEPDLEAIPVHS